MLGSVKVRIKDSKVFSDGTSPIVLQFIVNRKTYYKVIAKCPLDHFDKRKCMVKSKNYHHVQINNIITTELHDAQRYLLECQDKNKAVDPKGYFNRNKHLGTTMQDILEMVRKEWEDKGNNRQQKKYKSAINHVKASGLSIIDKSFPDKFENYLKKKGLKPNSRASIHNKIKTALNKQDNPEYFIYRRFKMPSEEVVKNKLEQSEIEMMETAVLNGALDTARDIFLFCYYSRGVRIGDALMMLRSNIVGDRLVYKTSKSGKNINQRIIPKAADIIAKYQGKFIFPYMDKKKLSTQIQKEAAIESCTMIINKNLKLILKQLGITKHISTHISRHSFAAHMDKSGLSLSTIQQLLDHNSLKDTERYIKQLRKDEELDNAVEGLF